MRLIDADKLKIEMMKAFDCEDATKYGNKNAEQQAHSYSTLMLYEISNVVEDCIDNAPTVEEESTGEWECVRVGNTNFITCSHCKEQFETENTLELWQDEYKFCHRCGAKMGGEEE